MTQAFADAMIEVALVLGLATAEGSVGLAQGVDVAVRRRELGDAVCRQRAVEMIRGVVPVEEGGGDGLSVDRHGIPDARAVAGHGGADPVEGRGQQGAGPMGVGRCGRQGDLQNA